MLSLSTEQRGPYTVVKVAGNLDLVTRDQFDQFMTKVRRANKQVIVDMSAVTFMDTGCLAVIVGHWKKLLSGSGNLILAGPQHRPAKALWITGLAYRLPLYDSVDEAIASADAIAPPAGLPPDRSRRLTPDRSRRRGRRRLPDPDGDQAGVVTRVGGSVGQRVIGEGRRRRLRDGRPAREVVERFGNRDVAALDHAVCCPTRSSSPPGARSCCDQLSGP
jgi:anti-anti-sigma factor